MRSSVCRVCCGARRRARRSTPRTCASHPSSRRSRASGSSSSRRSTGSSTLSSPQSRCAKCAPTAHGWCGSGSASAGFRCWSVSSAWRSMAPAGSSSPPATSAPRRPALASRSTRRRRFASAWRVAVGPHDATPAPVHAALAAPRDWTRLAGVAAQRRALAARRRAGAAGLAAVWDRVAPCVRLRAHAGGWRGPVAHARAQGRRRLGRRARAALVGQHDGVQPSGLGPTREPGVALAGPQGNSFLPHPNGLPDGSSSSVVPSVLRLVDASPPPADAAVVHHQQRHQPRWPSGDRLRRPRRRRRQHRRRPHRGLDARRVRLPVRRRALPRRHAGTGAGVADPGDVRGQRHRGLVPSGRVRRGQAATTSRTTSGWAVSAATRWCCRPAMATWRRTPTRRYRRMARRRASRWGCTRARMCRTRSRSMAISAPRSIVRPRRGHRDVRPPGLRPDRRPGRGP